VGTGPETFDTREEAEARCRELERASDTAWMAFPSAGRWSVVGTNLPRQEAPRGSTTEGRPRPPAPGDPRSGPGRDVPGYGGP
jgi:hypothetical protein